MKNNQRWQWCNDYFGDGGEIGIVVEHDLGDLESVVYFGRLAECRHVAAENPAAEVRELCQSAICEAARRGSPIMRHAVAIEVQPDGGRSLYQFGPADEVFREVGYAVQPVRNAIEVVEVSDSDLLRLATAVPSSSPLLARSSN